MRDFFGTQATRPATQPDDVGGNRGSSAHGATQKNSAHDASAVAARQPSPDAAFRCARITEQALDNYFTSLNGHGRDISTTSCCARSRSRCSGPCSITPRGNQSRAADILGINRGTLRKKLQELRHLGANDRRWRVASSGARCSAFPNKEGLVGVRARAARARRDAALDRRHRGAAARGGHRVTEVAQVTGFPEIMDGRVKTLHPKIHGGLLGRAASTTPSWREHGIEPIDLLVVNLYPFARDRSPEPGCTFEDAIENIDIGGPAMVRAAAKNHDRVDGGRRSARLCARCWPSSSASDGAVGANAPAARRQGVRAHGAVRRRRRRASSDARSAATQAIFPEWLCAAASASAWICATARIRTSRRRSTVEPHAQGASIGAATQLQGKDLSYNNIADADTAFECVRQFDDARLRHRQARESLRRCGRGDTLLAPTTCAYRTRSDVGFRRHHRLQPRSSTRPPRARDARAPVRGSDRRAGARRRRARACARKDNVRVLVTGAAERRARAVSSYAASTAACWCRPATRGTVRRADAAGRDEAPRPSRQQLDDLLFAWQVCKYVKSNAIVFARDGATIGIGAGQMSRVVSSAHRRA